jgi:hypothetical protein
MVAHLYVLIHGPESAKTVSATLCPIEAQQVFDDIPTT